MATDAREVGHKLLGAIRAHAGVTVGVGIALILTGATAICAPFVAGVSAMLVIGGLLVAGGIALGLLAFRVGAIGPGTPLLLMGVLMIIAGLYLISQPVAALSTMTLFLAAYLIVSGIVEIVAGFGARPEQGWGWMAFGGAVTLILGLMLWRQFPISGIWAIGTLFGVKLVMTGASMISLGTMVRHGVRGVEGMLKS